MITNTDLPALFQSADQHARFWQRRFYFAQGFQLVGLCIAAIGAVTALTLWDQDASGVLMVLGFVMALFARLTLYRYRPESRWFEGRAAAESIKTLAWRYAVCSKPFGKQLGEAEALNSLLQAFSSVFHTLENFDQPAGGDRQISQLIKESRSQSLADRKATYLQGRLRDQLSWYSSKSQENKVRARRWNQVLIGLDLTGFSLALVRLLEWAHVDIGGLLATLSGVCVAWLQTKNHEYLAKSYAVASQEISLICEKAELVRTEAQWAEFVEEAEESISREHTLWLASRSYMGGTP